MIYKKRETSWNKGLTKEDERVRKIIRLCVAISPPSFLYENILHIEFIAVQVTSQKGAMSNMKCNTLIFLIENLFRR